MTTPLCTVPLHFEYDLVAARRRARQIAAILGFDEEDQIRIATVASEVARNAIRHGGGGRFEFTLSRDHGAQRLVMKVSDHGPGIRNLKEVLSGRDRSSSGMGIGIVGVRGLMDDFRITSTPEQGTTVVMCRDLPATVRDLTRQRIEEIREELTRQRSENPLEEIEQQNAELLRALSELRTREEEQQRLNQELADTNRGVLALYAELDEKAEHLRHADQLKSRFLSDMSHEFRTPVNAILALSRLLEEANLGAEETKQVSLIRRAASDLENLVTDLLDLAKIEAGKIEIHPAEFEVANLFSALRGMFRPLLVNRDVSLVFEEPQNVPPMYSDEGKISQILRNFVSNALKFTEAGEVRVTAVTSPSGGSVIFAVSDSGIGIAAEDQERIFEDFAQIDGPLQRKQKGSGLGLPLTRKLAKLLGGSVSMRSELGTGSTFSAEIPVNFNDGAPMPRAHSAAAQRNGAESERSKLQILIVDDDDTSRYALASFARGTDVEIFEAENGTAGIVVAQSQHPDVILLDLMMPGVGGHEVLQRLKSDPATSDIPVVIVTSRFINEDEKQQILNRATAVIYKGDLSREVVSEAVARALGAAPKS